MSSTAITRRDDLPPVVHRQGVNEQDAAWDLFCFAALDNHASRGTNLFEQGGYGIFSGGRIGIELNATECDGVRPVCLGGDGIRVPAVTVDGERDVPSLVPQFLHQLFDFHAAHATTGGG